MQELCHRINVYEYGDLSQIESLWCYCKYNDGINGENINCNENLSLSESVAVLNHLDIPSLNNDTRQKKLDSLDGNLIFEVSM